MLFGFPDQQLRDFKGLKTVGSMVINPKTSRNLRPLLVVLPHIDSQGVIQRHSQEPDVVTYNTLINGYSKQLAWEDSLATLINGKNSGTL